MTIKNFNVNQIENNEIFCTNEAEMFLIKFSGQQRSLYETLLEKSEKLAKMYLGALTVLIQAYNPERFVQASHSIRELIEKIPALVDVEIKAQKESLTEKIKCLSNDWEDTLKNSNCYKNQDWNGQLDAHLNKLLKKIEAFFKWFSDHYPRRKAEIEQTLRRLDCSTIPLPQQIENLNFKSWDLIKDYFQGVSHHGKMPLENEFSQWLNALERFLLDRLHPRTYEDISNIDTIIQIGEKND